MVEQIVDQGLTVRAVEELVRQGGSELRVVPDAPEMAEPAPSTDGMTSGVTPSAGRRPAVRKLPEPGVLELEDLLSTYLNTRVKVDIQNRRGGPGGEIATLGELQEVPPARGGDSGA